MAYIVQTHRLCKRVGKREILRDVELHVAQGEIYGFLGPNGAGKTTVMKLLTNLWKPTAGSVELFGAPLRPGDYAVFRRMGSIIEFPAFFEHLSGRENLNMHCAYMGYHTPGAVDEALELLHLSEDGDKRVRSYSLGMRQRLGLARAVLTRPELLILDEPVNALDVASMKQVRDLLHMLCRDWGTTVLFSSHLLSEVEQIADTVGIIHRGSMIRELSLREITEMNLSYLELVSPDVNRAACALEEMGVQQFKVMDGNVVRIYENGRSAESLCQELVGRGVAIASFQKHAQTLEGYYLKMTGEGN